MVSEEPPFEEAEPLDDHLNVEPAGDEAPPARRKAILDVYLKEISRIPLLTPEEEELAELEGLRHHPLSLEAPVGVEGKGTLGDLVEDRQVSQYNSLSGLLKERADLAEVLDALNEKERTVLRSRFGLDGAEPMTLEAIGHDMGLTRERVRQIEAARLKKLRKLLASRGVDATGLFA